MAKFPRTILLTLIKYFGRLKIGAGHRTADNRTADNRTTYVSLNHIKTNHVVQHCTQICMHLKILAELAQIEHALKVVIVSGHNSLRIVQEGTVYNTCNTCNRCNRYNSLGVFNPKQLGSLLDIFEEIFLKYFEKIFSV